MAELDRLYVELEELGVVEMTLESEFMGAGC